MTRNGPIPPGDLIGHGEWPLFEVVDDDELDKMVITIDRRHPSFESLVEVRIGPDIGIVGATFET